MSRQLKLLNLPKIDSLLFEKELYSQGITKVAGLDEVGRGCLAGPVVAAAVILHRENKIEGIDDSKKLTPKKREFLFERIKVEAVSWAVVSVSPQDIDRMNILRASLEAMRLSLLSLDVEPEYLLIDGHEPIKSDIPQKAIKKGDARSISVGAASIVAKVTRDRMMVELEKEYPHFSFSIHKGYGTKLHLEELKKHGPTPIHRMTFAPVMGCLRR
ncbi:MAG: ribonuclease HII [Pseudomonadota bacterium]